MKALSVKKKIMVDFSALVAKHGDKRAVGNASLNARGDILDESGKIIKTHDQITMDYNTSGMDTVKHVSLKDMLPKDVISLDQVPMTPEIEEFKKKSRRIVDK